MISDISVVQISVLFFSGLGVLKTRMFLEKKKISQEKKMSATILQRIPKENAVFKGIFYPKI